MIKHLVILSGLLLLFEQPMQAAARDASPPNIILFLIDDWGWTDLGAYGSKLYETPQIDRLAAQGMKFTQAYAACMVCSPSRAAVMTGKYPARLRVTDWIPGAERPFAMLKIPQWTPQLPLAERTIAEELQARGYRTGHFGKWHLGGEGFGPEKHGFDVNFGGCHLSGPRSYFPPYGIPVVTDEQPGEFLTDRTTREVVAFIEENRARPFFAYVPHYAVHMPLGGKPAVIEKYQKKIVAGINHTNAVYGALVESVDDSVGAVMKKLAELKLEENTVIVVTSDNGGLTRLFINGGWGKPLATDNSPLREGKGSVYEGGVRVPLMVKWPGVTRPGSVNETTLVSGVDFFPTLLDIARAPTADWPPVDGESLVPVLKGGAASSSRAVYWHYPHYHPGGATPYSAVREGDWKLIHFFENDRVELYNLKDDVGETRDRAQSEPRRAGELRAKLNAWRAGVGAQLPSNNPGYDPDRKWERSPPAGAKQGGAKKG